MTPIHAGGLHDEEEDDGNGDGYGVGVFDVAVSSGYVVKVGLQTKAQGTVWTITKVEDTCF